MKKLSVIIPAWQAEKYIGQAIDSVKQQAWEGEKEIIIVDDGSSDNTAFVAQSKGAVVLRKVQGGAASARNMGLHSAAGDYILLLDADDILAEDALETLYEPMQKNPHVMAVFGKAEDFVSEELTDQQKAALKQRNGSYGGVLPGCSLIKKEVFETIGLFDETLKSGETVSWQMKFREAGITAVTVDKTVLKRRLHLTNTGRLNQKEEMKNYAALLRERMRKR